MTFFCGFGDTKAGELRQLYLVNCRLVQIRKHNGQHVAHDGEVRQQPGRAGGREDSTVHGGEEKGGHAALQHDACVSTHLASSCKLPASKSGPDDPFCQAGCLKSD